MTTPPAWDLVPASVETYESEVLLRLAPEAAESLAHMIELVDDFAWSRIGTELRAARAKLVDQVDVPFSPTAWHPCPARCGRRIRTGHIMCPACWTRVPDPVRHLVWARLHEWRGAGPDQYAAAEVAFNEARVEALDAALGDPLMPETQETPC